MLAVDGERIESEQAQQQPQAGRWRNRIVGHGSEAPDQLLANPKNWRIHPQQQQDALAGVLDQVGWVQNVIVNQRSGFVVDGHARITLAMRRDEPQVPVLYVDLSDLEEDLILATLDPLAALAGTDNAKLGELVGALASDDAAVRALLDQLALDAGVARGPQNVQLEDEGGDELKGAFQPLVYSAAEVEADAFDWFRAHGFPYIRVDRFVAKQQINKLAALEGDALMRSIIANRVADTYHPHRFDASAIGMRSPMAIYLDDEKLRKALSMWLTMSGALQPAYFPTIGLMQGAQTCGNFRPGFACSLYREFAPLDATVLDTSTGYGGRLIGFIASLNCARYIGIDPSTKTHAGNLALCADLGIDGRVQLINKAAEDVTSKDIADDSCDFAFTSPPYFSKELYADEPTQSFVRYKGFDEWCAGFLRKMLALQYRCLKRGAINAVNIADVKIKGKDFALEAATERAARDAGFKLVERRAFHVVHQRMGANQEEGAQSEPVFIFEKE